MSKLVENYFPPIFTEEEDHKLKQEFAEKGRKWTKIARLMGNNYTLIFVKYRILLLNAIEKIEAGEDDEVELENPLNVDDDTSKSYIGFMKHYYNQTNYSKIARADSNDSEEESDMQIPV